jgi:uncharacterized protein (DUF1015 family)
MARVFPFQPYRYAPSSGPIENLVTQPYDKISPAMQSRYLSLSPYNLVRVILGERRDGDSAENNVYTRAAAYFNQWIAGGILVQDPEPAFYPYFQEFTDPDSGQRLVRKGFIGLGQIEEYSAGVVHRHEQTLSGPKKDRLEVLRHTQAHFGQIFMLYPDPAGAIDAILDAASAQAPVTEVRDEYDGLHKLWRIADPAAVARISDLMAGKKLVIADGHHRYETALNYSKESPLADARRVMMTFVNMHSPGLRILATHRVVRNLENFDAASMLSRLSGLGALTAMPEAAAREALSQSKPGYIVMGVVLAGDDRIHLLNAPRAAGALDVPFLHKSVLEGVLGIGEEAVREEKYLKYVRGIGPALAEVREGRAQIAFLLQPTKVEEVAQVSFSGGVMPQKSTDFYPKLLSGLTIYRLEK